MVRTAPQGVTLTLRTDDLPPEELIFGRSAAMQEFRQRIPKFAATNVPLLIQGASGTGKGVLARYIHSRSSVAAGPFVSVNCAAIPCTLLESELFGYEKGAFTGAYASKPGRVEMAHTGTLFLDGIDEIDLPLQAKLLQLLQDAQFSRIGGREDITVQIRVICATSRPLEHEIAVGRFRADLYYRINVATVELPTLRSRIEDVPQLARYFYERLRKRYKSSAAPISPLLLKLFEQHTWPGNIRELENLMERYVILGSEEAISEELVSWERTPIAPELPTNGPIQLKKVTRKAVRELEGWIILSALEANRWNRKRAARDLRISYRSLLYKIRQAGLNPPHARIA
ncbi:MAG: sigma-54-dependent Fis family transcriptional regulator [Acidobacteria bacterium]|nr:MAG: sigma-54-dependent Fis family transcriptional regulator [Acidobacteriota bacterium]